MQVEEWMGVGVVMGGGGRGGGLLLMSNINQFGLSRARRVTALCALEGPPRLSFGGPLST